MVLRYIDNSEGTGSLKLKKAILLYGSTKKSSTDLFATTHPISEINGAPYIMPGTPLKTGALRSAIAKLNGVDKTVKWINPYSVLEAPGLIAWWRPEQRSRMFFGSGSTNDLIKLSGKMAPQPPLFFIYNERRLMVFALPCNERPHKNSKLMLAPYANIYPDTGFMCAGNMRLPEKIEQNTQVEIESSFFNSEFTHSNAGKRKLIEFKGGINALWKSLITKNSRKFPVNRLMSSGFTLEQIINQAVK